MNYENFKLGIKIIENEIAKNNMIDDVNNAAHLFFTFFNRYYYHFYNDESLKMYYAENFETVSRFLEGTGLKNRKRAYCCIERFTNDVLNIIYTITKQHCDKIGKILKHKPKKESTARLRTWKFFRFLERIDTPSKLLDFPRYKDGRLEW